MIGNYIFSFLCGAISCLFVLGWRSQEYEPGEKDGFCFLDEEDTQEYGK